MKIQFMYFGTFISLTAKKSGRKVRIQRPLLITQEYLQLGDFVVIWKNARIEGISQYNSEKFNPDIVLGNYVSIQQNIHLTCANCIKIGDYTAIASNVTITDIDHPYHDISTPIELQDIQVHRVEIGEGCKIYNNTVILPGVILGKHCVVAANSVVRANHYPDFSVIGGNPARILKSYNPRTGSWEKPSAE